MKHNTHKMEHMKDYFASVTNRLKDNLKLKSQVVQIIISNYKKSEGVMHNNALKVSTLKKEIQQRGEDVKKDIDSIVAELIKNIDGILGQHNKEAGAVLVKLKGMETNLNAEIETLQQKLDNVNYENVVETSSFIVERKDNVPSYNGNVNVSLSYDVSKQKNLKQIFGCLTKGWTPLVALIVISFISTLFNFNEQFSIFTFKAPKLKLTTTMNLNPDQSHDDMISFAPTQSYLFVCRSNYVMWSNNQRLNFKTLNDLKNVLAKVTDLLHVNNILYVSGYGYSSYSSTNLIDRLNYIFKFVIANNQSSLFYKVEYNNYVLRLSKSYLSTLLLILRNKIMHFTEQGKIMKTINLPFQILDALQLQEKLYAVISDSELCLVNDFGEKILRYSSDLDIRDIKSPGCLTKDNFGNIYVFSDKSNNKKIFVLDQALNFRSSHDIGHVVLKMCYDESKDTLLVLKNDRTLLTFQLWVHYVYV